MLYVISFLLGVPIGLLFHIFVFQVIIHVAGSLVGFLLSAVTFVVTFLLFLLIPDKVRKVAKAVAYVAFLAFAVSCFF